MFVQVLQYGTGIVSVEELEGDAVLLDRRLEMVWAAPVRLLVDLKVVSPTASQAGADVVLELQALVVHLHDPAADQHCHIGH